MYRFPVRIPLGWRIILTQGFKSEKQAEWNRAQGRVFFAHEAVDIVIGNPDFSQTATYGASIVCPFPSAKLVRREDGGAPTDPKAGLFQISYTQGTVEYIMGGLHCSEVIDKPVFKEGEVVAYIGNNGYVNPPPTKAEMFNGGHLHLSMTIKKNGGNGTPEDPLIYFDINNPYRGDDSGANKDIPPLAWAFGLTNEKVKEMLDVVRKRFPWLKNIQNLWKRR